MQARFAGFGQLVQGVGPAVGAPGCQRQRMGQPGPCLSKGGGSPLMASASRAQLVARPGAACAPWAGPAVVRGPYMGRCPIPHGHPSHASAGAVANAPRWPRPAPVSWPAPAAASLRGRCFIARPLLHCAAAASLRGLQRQPVGQHGFYRVGPRGCGGAGPCVYLGQ